MPFSHHSHSGQFCAHAKGTLEEMIQAAVAKGFDTFALTEHMPRDDEDLYPEEQGQTSAQGLTQLFDDYYREAQRLREKYQSQIHILIGFEAEWIRPSSLARTKALLEQYRFDLFIGSVHHTHTVPIDFDQPMYVEARARSSGTDEGLFEFYYDAQYNMLQALRPPMVGHFDLIRLLSDEPNRDPRTWDTIWAKMLRNLEYIADYGGLLEINTAGLRKGLAEPYPSASLCRIFLQRGGRFTLSDDSHQVGHVGTNYHKLPGFLESAGIQEVYRFVKAAETRDERFPGINVEAVSVRDIVAKHASVSGCADKIDSQQT
ncbi:polymerase/histidinol phosphatase-like protein [Phyllosticta citriasiana]|uniref:polymerase/histidinol phosphatase-like protein n=1 Tax=Phyllosticta citriasiana TaxID=595635 RepID=UPI0030FD6FC3